MRRTVGRRTVLAGMGAAVAAAGHAAAREWRVVPDGCVTAAGTWLPYNVFLPSGFDPRNGPHAVLVLLHGAHADEQYWAGQIRLWRAVEGAVAAGRIPAPIALMPGAPEAWWIDSPAALAETAVVQDLLADAALKYPLAAARSARAIAGYSAGGYGALRIALKYPALFGAAALWAPAIYAETPPPISAARTSPAFAGADGRFDPARWRRHAWPGLLPAYLAQTARVAFFLAAGEADPLGIASETRRLAAALQAAQPERVTARFVAAGHTAQVWEETVEEALGLLLGPARHPADPAAG